LLFSVVGSAQDLPDPGRRLSDAEQKQDPEQRGATKQPSPFDTRLPERARDPNACKNARINYQLSCGPEGTYKWYGRGCAEAYALYRQNCP
jgi:hypothetical protein